MSTQTLDKIISKKPTFHSEDERLLQLVKEGVQQLDMGMGVPNSVMISRSQKIIDVAKAV